MGARERDVGGRAIERVAQGMRSEQGEDFLAERRVARTRAIEIGGSIVRIWNRDGIGEDRFFVHGGLPDEVARSDSSHHAKSATGTHQKSVAVSSPPDSRERPLGREMLHVNRRTATLHVR